MDHLGLPKPCPARLTVFEVGCSLEALTCDSPRCWSSTRSLGGEDTTSSTFADHTSSRTRTPGGVRASSRSPGGVLASFITPNTTGARRHRAKSPKLKIRLLKYASASEARLSHIHTNKLARALPNRNSKTPHVGSLPHGSKQLHGCETPVAQHISCRMGAAVTPQSAVTATVTHNSSNKKNCGRILPKSAARVHDRARREPKRASRRRDLSTALTAASTMNGVLIQQTNSRVRRKSRNESCRRPPRARVSSLDMLSVSSSPRVAPLTLRSHRSAGFRRRKKVKQYATEVSPTLTANLVLRLPGDLRTSVLAWLSVDDLVLSSHVCHLWRNESSTPVLWREHCRHLASSKSSRQPLTPLSLQALQFGNERSANESNSPKEGNTKLVCTPKEQSLPKFSTHADVAKSAPVRARYSEPHITARGSTSIRLGKKPAISSLLSGSTSSTKTDWKRAYRLRAKRLKASVDNKLKRSWRGIRTFANQRDALWHGSVPPNDNFEPFLDSSPVSHASASTDLLSQQSSAHSWLNNANSAFQPNTTLPVHSATFFSVPNVLEASERFPALPDWLQDAGAGQRTSWQYGARSRHES